MCWLSKTVFRMTVAFILLKWQKTEDFMLSDDFLLKNMAKMAETLKRNPIFPRSPRNRKMTVHALKVAKHP